MRFAESQKALLVTVYAATASPLFVMVNVCGATTAYGWLANIIVDGST
jgi:hypothetical protein